MQKTYYGFVFMMLLLTTHRVDAFRVQMRSVAQDGGNHRTGARAIWLLTLILVVTARFPGVVGAATGDIGFQDSSISGTGTPTGTKRAESQLWWNDGSWWAHMWDSVSQDFHIFRLDTSTQTWVDTGVTTEPRANTHADVLWDGTRLHIASHTFVNDGLSAVSGYPSYEYRFTYNATTKSYSPDPSVPRQQINNMKTETLVIDRDSTGTLWATWQQDNQIYLARTAASGLTWGTPLRLLPAEAATSVTVDDNSAVVAFGGNQIGVMWSNQSTANDAMFFAVHVDGQPDTDWSTSRAAIQGSGTADDHINLKSLSVDASGRVYAAVKTSFTSSAQPLIMLLVRDPSTGAWASYTISRVSDCPNRPIVLIDEENRLLHAFFTAPASPGFACNSSGGAIYEKISPLDDIAFPVGQGTVRIQDADSPYMHNVTSTKQNLNSRTGLAVLAANASTGFYWHAYQSLPSTDPPPAGAPVADFSATPTSGTSPLAVQFTDLSTGGPTSWDWNLGDGTSSAAQNPSHSYASPGTYTVSLTAANSSGVSAPMTKTGYITVSAPPTPPVADFSATPTSGTAPLAVQFTDLSTGGPTSWAWDFGDTATSTSQNPSHSYASPGTYTVSLTATNAIGSNTTTKTDYITANPPPPDFSIAATPSSQTVVRGNNVTYTVTITPTNGFAGTVNLAVSGLPSGATAGFSPTSVSGSGSSTLTVSTTSTTKNGGATLTIRGDSGSLIHTTTVSLVVKRK